MKLRLAPQALRNIDEIADDLRPRSPAGSQHVSEPLENGFAVIAAYPHAGRRFKMRLRRLVVTGYPYLIYHRVRENAGIVAIRHGARSLDFGG